MDSFSKAELNTESSLSILREVPAFTIRSYKPRFELNTTSYSLKRLACIAGNPKLFAELLSMDPGKNHDLFRDYCEFIMRIEETRYSQEITSMLLKHLLHPREREVWPRIAKLIRASAIPLPIADPTKLDPIAVDLCELAIEEGLEISMHVQPGDYQFGLYPILRNLHTELQLGPKYRTTVPHFTMGIAYDRGGPYYSLHYKIIKSFISCSAELNVLDQVGYTVLDLALGRV